MIDFEIYSKASELLRQNGGFEVRETSDGNRFAIKVERVTLPHPLPNPEDPPRPKLDFRKGRVADAEAQIQDPQPILIYFAGANLGYKVELIGEKAYVHDPSVPFDEAPRIPEEERAEILSSLANSIRIETDFPRVRRINRPEE